LGPPNNPKIFPKGLILNPKIPKKVSTRGGNFLTFGWVEG